MNHPLRIAVAGLGTVGSGVCALLQENATLLADRAGRAITLTAVSARDRHKPRPFKEREVRWNESALKLAHDPEIDVVVELIGGEEGIARELVEAALANGKHVVTANKALIARHGVALAKRAEQAGVQLCFEAGVAGGVPLIKALRESLAANRFSQVMGILNGTCNFILSLMSEQAQDFAPALLEAQRVGFAEADPSFDIDGIDTGHKLAILTSLAYGCPPDMQAMHIEGIRAVSARDIAFARELGYAVKLLGIVSETTGGVVQRVHPALVPQGSALADTRGGGNAVLMDGNASGRILLAGAGAGAGPTASSVVGDILDIARGGRSHPFGVAAAQLAPLPRLPMDELSLSYYVRLSVQDKPGVLATVTGLFRDEGISLRSFLQPSHQPGEKAELVLTTHTTREAFMQRVLTALASLDVALAPPHMIRIAPL